MTTARPLSTIEKVELREAWPNEAKDFTPWLAKNITALGDALGFALELQQTEAQVGGYSLDILATDVDGNRPVVIENQLEPTNHDHLGKLLTYASGYDANVVVWLTKEFRDEHRQALDWLNQRTGEDTQFFGVVVELWKIDDSRPAPHFNLVVTPNDWRLANHPLPPPSEHGETNRLFRGALDTKLLENGITPGTTKNPTVSFRVIESPFPYIRYIAVWSSGELGFKMSFEKPGAQGRDWNQWLFRQFEERQTTIESGIAESDQGERIVWEPKGIYGGIVIYRIGNIYDELDSWDGFQDWIINKFFRFKEVFDPYLKELVG